MSNSKINKQLFKPNHQFLKDKIEYFLFIQNNNNTSGKYTTLPNSNLCLSVYNQNNVDWTRNENKCLITYGNESVVSRLYGQHKKKFEVSYSGQFDQICIIFSPGGLADFTGIPLFKISGNEEPLSEIFGSAGKHFFSRMFEIPSLTERVHLLELFFLNNYRMNKTGSLIKEILLSINAHSQKSPLTVTDICKKFYMEESTLYRNFKKTIGDSPKNIIKTIRFRKALYLLRKDITMTEIAHLVNYSDQSHFNRDVKSYTGLSPRVLRSNIKVLDNELYLLK